MRLPILTTAVGVASLLCFLACSEAASIEGQVLGVTFRGRVTRGVSTKTKVALSGSGRYQTHVGGDGTFTFPDLPTGTYILEVDSPHLSYSKVRIAVTANEMRATQVSLGDHFSDNQMLLSMPLILRPRTRPTHYIPPEGARVAGWFANPMVLMSSFSVLMVKENRKGVKKKEHVPGFLA
ncbi:hypothetical protein EDD21DRAFT_99439 [Dissophora ornata]|nr:hypothetical protein EDD21DRAFT_99439 [Dissophora ornata]